MKRIYFIFIATVAVSVGLFSVLVFKAESADIPPPLPSIMYFDDAGPGSAGDGNWNTLSNWWLIKHSSPSVLLPINLDSIHVDRDITTGPSSPITLTSLDVAEHGDANLETADNITVVGTSTFGVASTYSSVLTGTLTGNAVFHHESVNSGTVSGDAVFYGDDSENSGTVSGMKTRYYDTTSTTTRNFVVGGPWTVIADGVTVDVSGATHDGDTVFIELNGGDFIYTVPVPPSSEPVQRGASGRSGTSVSQRASVAVEAGPTTDQHAPFHGGDGDTHEPGGCLQGYLFSTKTGERCIFVRNLSVGSRGEDVRQLQIYLNAQGFSVALSGPGSAGSEIDRFGPLTRAALARFQQAKGITPATGYFGTITRGLIGR